MASTTQIQVDSLSPTEQERREALDRAKKPRRNVWRAYENPKAPRPDKDRVIPHGARMGIRP